MIGYSIKYRYIQNFTSANALTRVSIIEMGKDKHIGISEKEKVAILVAVK